MNVFTLHESVITEYKRYIHSFVKVDNERIKEAIDSSLEAGKLWKQPLIQFNPAFLPGQSVSALIQQGELHPELNHVFAGYELYKHQEEAIRLGSAGKGFVVTSGTGSGKSLTFIGSIVNYYFQQQAQLQPGVKAIIIYPMNALINSQYQELEKYASNYAAATGRTFPITFGQYTGQEKEDRRREMQNNPPDILLTNYMMLELLLTRNNDGEPKLRQSIYQNLRFLAFDELHTFRGRQGADVALLTRRLIRQAIHLVTCIGTSATMVSGGTFAEQKQRIAEVATLFFGQLFTTEQVIHESLAYSIGNQMSFDAASLQRLIDEGIQPTDDIRQVQQHPLSAWLEKTIALREQEAEPVRNKPLTRQAITHQLAVYTGCSEAQAQNALDTLLTSISVANVKAKANGQKPVLPFKLHQFISQTGSVYMTLDSETITLEAGYFTQDDTDRKPLFPIVFSRESGVAFFCVTRQATHLLPREFDDIETDEQTSQLQNGYVILSEEDPDGQDKIWNPEEDLANLPDAWLNHNKNGERTTVTKAHRHHIPQAIYFNEQGEWADQPEEDKPIKGWFMPYKLPFDPTSGTFFDRQTSEGRKLTKLGSEGRSTSTTVLSFTLLKQLAQQGYDYAKQKVLSFTDNRQDAALQAGHFNDFLNTVQIRSAIYRAVSESPGQEADFSTIADRVLKALNLEQADYAKQPGTGIGPQKDNERTLKDYLTYRILEDLKRSWRIVLPNLEQCGLLKIRYNYLDEQCAEEPFWTDAPLLSSLPAAERAECIFQLLDYFRKYYALRYDEYLTQTSIDTRRAKIVQKLKPEWGFDDNEFPLLPNCLRPTTENPHDRRRYFTQSIGYSSAFGKYLRKLFTEVGQPLQQRTYETEVIKLLNKLVEAGWLYTLDTQHGPDFPLYQLNIDYLIWQAGDGTTIDPDRIKNPSYKPTDRQPNYFFRDVYQTDFGRLKKLRAEDHTGQITSTDERKQREQDFRAGHISALYCSPTMELGIDISSLDVVHMRNVPPSPANYAQRSGRAGRSGQAALVFTYCSAYAPHDRHYYRNEIEMVAGVVTAPRLDLANEELLRSHLHALYLAEVGMQEGNRKVSELLDIQQPGLPLSDIVRGKIDLSSERRKKLRQLFERVLADFSPLLADKHWFTTDWISIRLTQFEEAYDRAFDRWRKLYSEALRQLQHNNQLIDGGLIKAHSDDFKNAQREQRFAQKQLDLLKNEVNEPSYISEFYPFRYLASEGFLPGYNFTRLPLRTFVEQKSGTGEFISRPRLLALREFGPRNVIYHSGTKYEVNRIRVSDLDTNLTKAKVSLRTGYFLDGDQYQLDVCPFSGDALTTDAVRRLYVNLLDMAETRSRERDRITCEEEERVKQGYRLQTFFSVPGGMNTIRRATLSHTNDALLRVQYIPTARLIHVNEGWRSQAENGFRLNQFGEWLTNEADVPNAQRVQLYTYTHADALYIQPIAALGLAADGVVTLQYALKRAIETTFQIEPSELGVQLMGDAENPNIFLFEAAEGSLGILSQLVTDQAAFHRVVDQAIALCRFDDASYTIPASYDDLLSYYNQRDHQLIDRQLIREALDMLKAAAIELPTGPQFSNYDEQFRSMLNQYDTNSQLERKFLEYLYANNLRLPDKAQSRVDGVYSQPDFFYEPDFHVFIDGTVHDKPEVKEQDRKVRQAIGTQGQQCWVYRYDEHLADKVAERSDIFIKIR